MTDTAVDLVEMLACDFCSWEDTAEWIGVTKPQPSAMQPQYREGFSLCGFCYRSLIAAEWLSYRHAPSLMTGRHDRYSEAQDLAMFMNVQRHLTLGRHVSGAKGE